MNIKVVSNFFAIYNNTTVKKTYNVSYECPVSIQF